MACDMYACMLGSRCYEHEGGARRGLRGRAVGLAALESAGVIIDGLGAGGADMSGTGEYR